MLDYRLTERAMRDIIAARDWYEREVGSTAGDRLVDAVYAAVRTARERPTSFPEMEPGVRGALCKKFRYRVYFEVVGDEVVVHAVYHTSRDPARWDDPGRE